MEDNHITKYKRIVIKIGSHSLVHGETGKVDYVKMERLAMEISDLKNRGIEVCLVSSGAIAVGRQLMGYDHRPKTLPEKQALAAIGQARLMALYQRFFSEYNQKAGQVLMTKNTMLNNVNRKNVENTMAELFHMGVIPVVNENDTVNTFEVEFGDNDTLSALVTSLIDADLLIILTDTDGLYTSNPRENAHAELVRKVETIDEKILAMVSDVPGSDVGTGGMSTKLKAARIATRAGADMIIANGADVRILHRIIEDDYQGTFFAAHYDENFDLLDELEI